MAKIICPMCATLNTGEAETCSYCGARLPAAGAEEIPFARDAAKSDDLFEQLRSLGSDLPEESLPDDRLNLDDETAADGEEPDWLKRIQQLSTQQGGAPAGGKQAADADDVPDWMRALASPETEPDHQPVQTGAQEPGSSNLEALPEEPNEAAQLGEGGELPDWLEELNQWSPDERAGAPLSTESIRSDEIPAEDVEPPVEADLPVWLQEMTSSEAPVELSIEDEEKPVEVPGEEPSLLPGLSEGGFPEAEGELAESPEEELAAWLNSFAQPEPPAEADRDEDVNTDPVAARPGSPDAGTALSQEDDPLLATLALFDFDAEPPPTASAPAGAGARDDREGDDTPGEPTAGAAIPLPAWLQSEQAGETSPDDTGEPAAGEPPVEADLPDWLAQMEPGVSPTAALQPPEDDLVSDGTDEAPAIENLADWLGDLSLDSPSPVFEAQERQPGEPPAAPGTTPPFFREGLSNWMDEPAAGEPVEVEPGPVAPQAAKIQESVLPDWLDEPVSKAPETERAAPAPKEEEQPRQATLPDWLAAMRPIETVLPEQAAVAEDKKVEQAGPLAGMRSVLPAQDVSALYRKPPIYSLKLQVSEKQRAHAAMLENMLEEESRPAAGRRPARRSPQRTLRFLIGLALIAAILLPLLGIPPAGVKVGQLAFIDDFSTAVEAIPDGAPVLLVVEYAPGFSGEMRLAATSVLQRLMMKEVRLAVLSTTPAGPLLAEDLKAGALALWPDIDNLYVQRDWYINLGYLPGESVSLQELVNRPQQALQYGISAGLENRLVWDSQVLENIATLADFGAVILLTDTVENGRSWIEQVQPALGKTPLLVISSAQAAPMLRPYLQSGQVQGLLAGAAGGVSYAETALIPDDGRSAYWLSNQFGLGAAILVLLLGAIVESIASLVGRRQDQEG